MNSFFTKMVANNATAGKVGRRIFGESFEVVNESDLKEIIDEAGRPRKILCACVVDNSGISPTTGQPFSAKQVKVFVSSYDGKPSKAYVPFAIKPDSELQIGQWLDINTLKVRTLARNGVTLRNEYLDGKPGNAPAKDILDAIGYVEDAPASPAQ